MPLIEVISSEEHVPTASGSSASKPASAAEVAAGISALGLDPTDAQGSEWSASEPAGLTNSERAQMDELREKYGKYQRERDGVGGGDAPHTDAALAQSQARMDADFRAREPAEITESSNTDDSAPGPGSRIKVCDVCRGMRVTHTEYNHRVMERMCERCEGEGVLQDGKPIVTPGSLAAEEAKEKQSKSMDAKVKEGMEKDHRLRRYAELFAVCELLEKKLDGYAQEIVDAQAKIADGNAKGGTRRGDGRVGAAGDASQGDVTDTAGRVQGRAGAARGTAGEGRGVRVDRGPGDGRRRTPVSVSEGSLVPSLN